MRCTSGQMLANTGPGLLQLCSQAGHACPTASAVRPGRVSHATGTQRLFSRAMGVPDTGGVPDDTGGLPAQPAKTPATSKPPANSRPWRLPAICLSKRTGDRKMGAPAAENNLANDTTSPSKQGDRPATSRKLLPNRAPQSCKSMRRILASSDPASADICFLLQSLLANGSCQPAHAITHIVVTPASPTGHKTLHGRWHGNGTIAFCRAAWPALFVQ